MPSLNIQDYEAVRKTLAEAGRNAGVEGTPSISETISQITGKISKAHKIPMGAGEVNEIQFNQAVSDMMIDNRKIYNAGYAQGLEQGIKIGIKGVENIAKAYTAGMTGKNIASLADIKDKGNVPQDLRGFIVREGIKIARIVNNEGVRATFEKIVSKNPELQNAIQDAIRQDQQDSPSVSA